MAWMLLTPPAARRLRPSSSTRSRSASSTTCSRLGNAGACTQVALLRRGQQVGKKQLDLERTQCDATAKLWLLEGSQPLGELLGQTSAASSRASPSRPAVYIGTASFDTSWRWLDAEMHSLGAESAGRVVVMR